MSNQPPIEVPQGAIRLNTDSQRLEFFAQDRWYEFATDSPTLDGGSRGLAEYWVEPGQHPEQLILSDLSISPQGNEQDFGRCNNRIKVQVLCIKNSWLYGGGYNGSIYNDNEIEFIT